ncbi:MAG: formate dehydrogenase accessory sulfurtransferase FdhD [Alphaproteobacteria bacterium]|nr:MAG: formate dehydrogenase accessory sulfurtransferase FdhD [Alphaproteobacteria bacterium]
MAAKRREAGGKPAAVAWHVPEEVPVAVVYDGLDHAIMLATPADLEDFAVGFSLSERVVDHLREILSIAIRQRAQGIDLKIAIDPRRLERLKLRQARRNLTGRSGCGVCGMDNAEMFFEPLAPVAATRRALDPAAVAKAVRQLADKQPLWRRNRSVHGAAWVVNDGAVALVREDVGRHNALDKLLGALVRQGSDLQAGFVLISSRCSYEIVEKAARLGVSALVGLSAPTAFAIRKAREARFSLNCYADGAIVQF